MSVYTSHLISRWDVVSVEEEARMHLTDELWAAVKPYRPTRHYVE
jgi:hypothetical protein